MQLVSKFKSPTNQGHHQMSDLEKLVHYPMAARLNSSGASQEQ